MHVFQVRTDFHYSENPNTKNKTTKQTKKQTNKQSEAKVWATQTKLVQKFGSETIIRNDSRDV